MKEFILLTLKTRTSPDFSLDDLPTAGRMDLVCRTVSNALWISNDIRRDTTIHVAMSGPKSPPKLISFCGKDIKGVEPDERSIAKYIKKALHEGLRLKLNEEKEVSAGIKISKKAFETFVKERAETGRLFYLHLEGTDLRKFDFKDNNFFILGDFIGLPRKTERLLKKLGAEKISLGPKILFASHCPIIVHNELDRRETSKTNV